MKLNIHLVYDTQTNRYHLCWRDLNQQAYTLRLHATEHAAAVAEAARRLDVDVDEIRTDNN